MKPTNKVCNHIFVAELAVKYLLLNISITFSLDLDVFESDDDGDQTLPHSKRTRKQTQFPDCVDSQALNFGADDTDNDFTNENLNDVNYEIPANELTQRSFDKMAKSLEDKRLAGMRVRYNADGTVPYGDVVFPEDDLLNEIPGGMRPEDDDTVIDRYLRNRDESDEEKFGRTRRKAKPKSQTSNLDRILSQVDAKVSGRLTAPATEIAQRRQRRQQQSHTPQNLTTHHETTEILRQKQIALVGLQIEMQKQLNCNALIEEFILQSQLKKAKFQENYAELELLRLEQEMKRK